MEPTVSKLQPYSIAIVAANKPLDSHDIEATPIEDLTMLDGEITDNVMEVTTSGAGEDGSSYQTQLQSTASVKATWLPLGGSNRKTAPDVRRGEYVVLYRFGDTDKYYWTTLFYDMKLRKLETIIFVLSNTQDESQDGTAENTYFMEFSSHNKLLHIHTSKSDGEPFVYDIQLNTKDGSLTIQDDIGNFFSFDSKNVRLELKNADGSHIDMDRQVINLYAPDTINLRADKEVNISAGSSFNSDAPHITTKSNKTDNEVPDTTFSGNIDVGGNADIAEKTTMKSFSSGGGGSGTFDVAGDGQFTGHVHVNKLTSSQPIDAPNVS